MAIKYRPTRITTNFALCGLILLIISTCKARLSEEEFKSKLRRHRQVLQQFPCQAPQPRSISAKELLGNQIATFEIAVPHVTVLHRCDKGTGCCSHESQVCTVAREEEVDLHFIILDGTKQVGIEKGGSKFREFKVTNHTLCYCASMNNPIK